MYILKSCYYISVFCTTLLILKSCIINRDMANGRDHHHIFTHCWSITFSHIMFWLFISPYHYIVFYTLIWTYNFFNQLNPFHFLRICLIIPIHDHWAPETGTQQGGVHMGVIWRFLHLNYDKLSVGLLSYRWNFYWTGG